MPELARTERASPLSRCPSGFAQRFHLSIIQAPGLRMLLVSDTDVNSPLSSATIRGRFRTIPSQTDLHWFSRHRAKFSPAAKLTHKR
jgi:hypothetical protein